MSVPILIVCPLFPPARGGLADHTQRLAHALSSHHAVSILTAPGAAADAECAVHPVVADWQDANALVAAVQRLSPTGVVVWQYVPHMYGRGGVTPALPRALAALRRLGRRQVVVAHEIAAPLSPWPHRAWYALAHRRQWRQIVAGADAIGFSTEAWLVEWRRRAPGRQAEFFLLPSPSSIPRVPVAADHGWRWREANALPTTARVLAYFGTLGAAKQFAWLTGAWRQAQAPGRPVALVVVGDRPRFEAPAGLERLFKPLGYLAAPEVSAALQATDLLALPFIDGVSERRTTFMAGLSQGCAVVATLGSNTGPSLAQADFFCAVRDATPAAFAQAVAGLLADDERRRGLGTAAGAAYAQRYDWPVVARALTDQVHRLNQPVAEPRSATAEVD